MEAADIFDVAFWELVFSRLDRSGRICCVMSQKSLADMPQAAFVKLLARCRKHWESLT
jgi:hypothetical protein